MQKKIKRWFCLTVSLSLAALILVIGLVIFVDPYFHYHAPLPFLGYKLDNERYQNDGIVKHFEYDAIITGSSMTENFKTSDLNAIFGTNAIKVPFAGGSYKEVNDLLRVAFKHNSNIKMIVRGLDYNRIFDDAEHVDYTGYPEFLYDDNPLNDVYYLLNSEVILIAVQNIIGRDANGKITIDFDRYAIWNDYLAFGKNAVDAVYFRNDVVRAETPEAFTQEDRDRIKRNIEENVLSLAKEHPETEFYPYFTPYSIAYMDYYKLEGKLEKVLEAEKYIIELLLPYENVKIYSFMLEDGLITNMDNYRDAAHHSAEVNSQILRWMKEDEGLITADNYEDYCTREREYLFNFDYDAYFADWD